MDYFCVITFQNNSLHLHYSVLQYKTLSYFQETFMTFFIQMCSICIIFAVLKIYFLNDHYLHKFLLSGAVKIGIL